MHGRLMPGVKSLEVTVKEMMNMIPGLKLLAGENGVCRKVVGVMFMDVPEGDHWVRKNEVAVSAGYIFKDNQKLLNELIVKLNNKGASAFIIKTSSYLHTLSSEALETADELGFPIIDIPQEYHWADVSTTIIKKIIFHEIEIKQRNLLVSNLLNNLVKDTDELNMQARSLGWNFENGIAAIVVEQDITRKPGQKNERVFEDISAAAIMTFTENFQNPAYLVLEDQIVFLISPKNDNYDEFREYLKNECTRLCHFINKTIHATVSIGVGSIKLTPTNASISFHEAQQAIKLSRILHKGGDYVFFEELGIYYLLFQLKKDIVILIIYKVILKLLIKTKQIKCIKIKIKLLLNQK